MRKTHKVVPISSPRSPLTTEEMLGYLNFQSEKLNGTLAEVAAMLVQRKVSRDDSQFKAVLLIVHNAMNSAKATILGEVRDMFLVDALLATIKHKGEGAV